MRTLRKPKSERQKLIKANDDLARKICHLRDKVCQATGKTENLQWCHFYTRSKLSVRWEEDNYCLLNGGTHNFWAHKYPTKFKEFWIKRIGQERFDRLTLRFNHTTSISNFALFCTNKLLQERLAELAKTTS